MHLTQEDLKTIRLLLTRNESQKDLAKLLGITSSGLNQRIVRYVKNGYLTRKSGFALNAQKFGVVTTGFFSLSLNSLSAKRKIETWASERPEIIEAYACHSGKTQILLKVLGKSIEELQKVQSDLLKIEGVEEVRIIVGNAFKESSAIPF
jgi:DNA-binding Lrp family transcriptional regulator